MRKCIFALVLLSFISSCKKSKIDDLPPTNDPVFKMSGQFDGVPIFWAAGEGEMVMANSQEDYNGILSFVSSISNGENGLHMRIMDDSPENPIQHFSLKAGDTIHMANRNIEPLGMLSLGSFENFDKIDNIQWSINGVFAGVNSVKIYEPGLYNICGEFHFTDNSTHTICNDVYLGYRVQPQITVKIKPLIAGQGTLEIEGVDKDNLSFIEWMVDGKVVSNSNTSNFYFTSNKAKVELTAHHNSGAIMHRELLADGLFMGNSIEDFSCLIQEPSAKYWNKSLVLELFNGSNELSSLYDDNYKNVMIIKSVESHGVNAENKEILKVTADIKAKMKTSTGGTSKLLEVEVVFPFVID